MSSEPDPDMLQQLLAALTSIQQNNNLSLAVCVAVGYDYILTFSSEIEYIWSKPWTWVSMLFVSLRYFGLFTVLNCLVTWQRKVVSTPAKRYPIVNGGFQGQVIGIMSAWAFFVFYAAAEFLVVLRIWAMYNRSKLVLGSLLTLYSAVMIATLISIIVNSIPKNLPAQIVQILDFSYCSLASAEPTWSTVAVGFQIAQGGTTCTLAIVQVVRQSHQMYRATKAWQLNQYMGLLVKQGILSFIAILLFNLANVLAIFGSVPSSGWGLLLLIAVEYVPIYTLTPRFVLSMRELYARDAQGRREDVDTAFGLSVADTMVFAAAGPNEVSEDVEEIQMEVGTSRDV